MPKINGNEIRPGTIVEHDGGLWASVKVNHVKPGKGGAFAQVELKNLRDGRKLNERFRSEDKVEQVRLDNKDQQFLYETDGKLVFMDGETYEQTEMVQNGQTASKSYKPAVLDNGVRIMVPPFINMDEMIIVHTELMEYSERA